MPSRSDPSPAHSTSMNNHIQNVALLEAHQDMVLLMLAKIIKIVGRGACNVF